MSERKEKEPKEEYDEWEPLDDGRGFARRTAGEEIVFSGPGKREYFEGQIGEDEPEENTWNELNVELNNWNGVRNALTAHGAARGETFVDHQRNVSDEQLYRLRDLMHEERIRKMNQQFNFLGH